MADDDDKLSEEVWAAEEIADTLTVSASTFSRVLRTGMRHAVVEGHSLERVLKRAALSISNGALVAGLRPLTNLVGGGASGLFGGLAQALAGGAVSAATDVVPFAEGGVIGSPTAFPMGGGRVGLMGEAGREAVLPLARGPDGRLGVALEGERGAPVINVNITTPDAASFQRSEAQVTAMLARAVARGRRGL
ncbi:phage tail tape measure protein [Acuticoccus mangrovi]|uniref:Phage tail tape measure protein n=1 Tax=Acuticoccus mangrovi TaxID=2796142 RepID=A0A934ILW7_9HYPH|nr:phage tail tape measure protein [Acuticoccus mangrovi]MBJ3774816.1 phage tail tape measure protein [Acuticoccus mangrovi]